MKEKFQKIYSNKDIYYLNIIEEFEAKNIPFILINYLIADDNPGDLDVLINENNFKEIELILKNNDFNYYTNFNTNQFLFNKYVPNIGFIQFHLYIGLGYMGKQIFHNIPKFSFPNDTLILSFYIFMIESFYRNNYKKYIYNKYLEKIPFLQLQKFVTLNYPDTFDVIEYANTFYNNPLKVSKIKHHLILLNTNKFFLLKYHSKRFYKIFKRIGNKDDFYVLFLGPDGSGKTTLLNNINSISSKGGYFPINKYFGLRTSLVHKTLFFLSKVFKSKGVKEVELKKNKPINDKISSNNFANFIKIVAYWIEYNLRFFFELKFKPKSAKTIYLIDRSFTDLLFYYPNKLTEILFMKYSFQPNNVIVMSGNATTLYSRKQEYTLETINKHLKFYNKLELIYKNNKISSLALDSALLDKKQCVYNSLNFFLRND